MIDFAALEKKKKKKKKPSLRVGRIVEVIVPPRARDRNEYEERDSGALSRGGEGSAEISV